jgi:hypothetical protein
MQPGSTTSLAALLGFFAAAIAVVVAAVPGAPRGC